MQQSEHEKKSQIKLLLSKEEKELLITLAKKENFATIAQFVRSRCLNDNLTNSELANLLMRNIGERIREEIEKDYPKLTESNCDLSKLKKPRKTSTNSLRSNELGKNYVKKIERTTIFGFLVTNSQKKLIEKNAQSARFKTVSKYIRARCLKGQILKKDLLEMINNFVKSILEDLLISPDKKIEWKKQKIKKDLNLSFVTLGLSEEKKELFEKSVKDLTEAYSNEIQIELNSLLQKQKLKIESAA